MAGKTMGTRAVARLHVFMYAAVCPAVYRGIIAMRARKEPDHVARSMLAALG